MGEWIKWLEDQFRSFRSEEIHNTSVLITGLVCEFAERYNG